MHASRCCGARTCYRVHAIELSTDAKRNSLSFPFEATRRFRLRRKPRYYLASQRAPVVTWSNRILACVRCARIAHGRRAFSNKEQSVIVIDCLRERALRLKFPLLSTSTCCKCCTCCERYMFHCFRNTSCSIGNIEKSRCNKISRSLYS